MPLKLSNDGVLVTSRMLAFTPGRADLNPPRRLARIQELIRTKAAKIAVVRGEGIGDVLMTTPTLKALHEQFEGKLDLTYATNTQYAEGALRKVLLYNPYVTSVVDRQQLDEADYDAVINLHCPAIAYEKFGNPPINRIDLFARHVGFSNLADPVPKLYLKPTELNEASTFLYSKGLYGKKLMMVQLFGTSAARSIDSAKIKAALTQLFNEAKVHSIITTHSTDKPSDIIWNEIPGSLVIKDKDVRGLASLMVYCDLVLCPDSALLHVAGALGVPTVGLFGPTDPRARVNYYSNAVAIWEGERLGGHPHWYEKCPYNDLCWKMITQDAIVQSCIQHMSVAAKVDITALLSNTAISTIQTDLA